MLEKRTIIEPFKIKMVEAINFLTPAQREEALKKAGYNLFLLPSHSITFDFLTDSGTTAMSSYQWGAMMEADETYAGSRSFEHFSKTVKKITGFSYVIPTHQGRAAERILFSQILKSHHYVPSNNHFDTTRANVEYLGAEAVDLVIQEGKNPASLHPFKGNIDITKLKQFCESHHENIPIGLLTITNNTGGGQPVSMANIRETAGVLHHYGIPFFLDACRFAENAYFIKLREPNYAQKSIPDIVKEMFSYADGCLMSAKKDGLVNIGGFIALKEDRWLTPLRNNLILTEGFPTYGGLAARDLEAMAVGLEEVLEEDYLKYRLAVIRYIADHLNKMGFPTVQPAGGHAVYIDAKAFLPHIPAHQFPGQSLVVALYLSEGIRSCEIGSTMFAKRIAEEWKPAEMELVRLAIPRRVYTQSHIDYILEGLQDLVQRKETLKGLRMIYEPPFLRHFTAQFEPL